MLTDAELAELARLEAEGVQGEWKAYPGGDIYVGHTPMPLARCFGSPGPSTANAALIVAARNALPALLDLVARQRKDYLDVADAIARESSGPADLIAEVRQLRNDAVVVREGHWDEVINERDALLDEVDELESEVRFWKDEFDGWQRSEKTCSELYDKLDREATALRAALESVKRYAVMPQSVADEVDSALNAGGGER